MNGLLLGAILACGLLALVPVKGTFSTFVDAEDGAGAVTACVSHTTDGGTNVPPGQEDKAMNCKYRNSPAGGA